MKHLRSLVDPRQEESSAPLTRGDLLQIRNKLANVKVLVQHIKPGGEAKIRRQIRAFQLQGIPLHILRQGASQQL
jgi:hypothetical protein